MQTTTTHDPKRLERAKRLIQQLQERTTENGCTEAEAMEAAAKIGALLADFDLELTEVMARDTSNMVSVDVYAPDYSMAGVITGIGRLCALVTYSKSGATVATYTLYGHKHDTELAVYLYEVCAEACETGWVAYMNQHGYSAKARDSYRLGFGGRVSARMRQMREQLDREAAERAAAAASNGTGTNLVLLKNQIVEAEFEKTGVRLTYTKGPKIHNTGAYHSGAAHGSTVNLNRPVSGPASRPAIG